MIFILSATLPIIIAKMYKGSYRHPNILLLWYNEEKNLELSKTQARYHAL